MIPLFVKRILWTLGFFVFALIVYVLLPKPWTNELESKLYWGAFLNNEKALTAFKGQDLSLATSQWAQGLSTSPGLMELHYNLALGWQLMNRSDESVKSYNILLKNPNTSSGLQFDSNFNMGVLHQTAKQVDPALQNYQAALDISPSSRETKINIELLIQEQQGGGQGQNQDQSEGDKGGEGDQSKKPDGEQDQDGKGDQQKDEPKEYAKNPPPQKKQFKSEQLSQSDVNKILGEIKQQEQKIRAEYNKKEGKEQPRDKDW